MRFVSFVRSDAGSPATVRFGVIDRAGGEILDLHALGASKGFGAAGAPPPSFLEWFDLDGPWMTWARTAAAAWPAEARVEAGAVRLLSPVPRPGKVLCVGLNYRDHAAEAKMAVPTSPVIFAKMTTSVIGPGEAVRIPGVTDKVDYEAELAIVVGRRTQGASAQEVLGAVLGYTNANDVSARDFQKLDGQWVRAKSCDTFCPLGPAIVTPDEAGNPNALDVRLRLNGQVLQDSNTREFVFDVGTLLAFINETITLEPGDVILTGTPPGVGFARQPPVYMRAGDRVEVEIENLGTLANPVA